MTTAEKIASIEAISLAVPVIGNFEDRHKAISKLSEIIESLKPKKCGCKYDNYVVSLPTTTPAS